MSETNVFDLFTGREISIMEFDRRVADHGDNVKPMPISGKEYAKQKRSKRIQKPQPLESKDGTQ